MVDFAKLGTQPREIDYLAYLIDECELNSWQRTAFPSMMKQVRSGYGSLVPLSPKQYDSMMKAVKEFDLTNDEFCVYGFADRSDSEVMNKVGPGSNTTKVVSGKDMAGNQGATGFHDMDYDDDIPF